MTRYHTNSSGSFPFTAEEETARDGEEALEATNAPMEIWHNKIHLSDRDMPRIYEDILDRDGTDGLPQVVIDRYNAKKALRATKP